MSEFCKKKDGQSVGLGGISVLKSFCIYKVMMDKAK